METPNSRSEKIVLYDKLFAMHPDAVRKGDTMPYTSLNGNMYSYFTKDDYLALKLPAQKRGEFILKYDTGLVFQYGIVQKEYVQVPNSLLQKTEELKTWFFDSYDYATTLKPKPSTKVKKKE
ncbi:hypothetical protein [Mucilaginibacter flavidus]|uniref:hypothetical protein n=1 Tax=Mucilaginibacter flavidus TaxID=2949309 RepID=UPI002092A532|nr:hypothetical protein [Mucilaginibacter flavidus]MCO5948371.1 hypothetical protein [Mucilaginibacter flavidus]